MSPAADGSNGAPGPASWVRVRESTGSPSLASTSRAASLRIVDDVDAREGDPVDVAEEELGLIRCARCRQRAPTRAGVLQPHHPGEGRTDNCPASGTRIATRMRPLAAIAFMAAAARVDVQITTKARDVRTLLEEELGEDAIAALKALHVRWTATRQQPHAQIDVRKQLAPVIAASINRLRSATLAALSELPIHLAIWRACAAFEAATLAPCAFIGGISDNGNAWGERIATVLPFAARARRVGREGKAYSARWMRRAFDRLADDGIAFRFARKGRVAKGWTSTRAGASGNWPSTGRVYPIRDLPSATYLATDPLRDLQPDAAHHDWTRAIVQVLNERFGWAWGVTKHARQWRRGYSYADALITHPTDKRERARVRSLRRSFWRRSTASAAGPVLIPAQRIALRENRKIDPPPAGVAPAERALLSLDRGSGLDPPPSLPASSANKSGPDGGLHDWCPSIPDAVRRRLGLQ